MSSPGRWWLTFDLSCINAGLAAAELPEMMTLNHHAVADGVESFAHQGVGMLVVFVVSGCKSLITAEVVRGRRRMIVSIGCVQHVVRYCFNCCTAVRRLN